MKTAIVSDSNCGISKSEAENLGLFIVPMPVCIENTFYYEGIDLDRKNFFNHLANHEKIHTSQPSPAGLLTMWENVFKSGYDELVYIPMSSGLSGSLDTACQMAEEFPEKVYVADVRRVSVTQRHAVEDAFYLLNHGFDAASIKAELELMRMRKYGDEKTVRKNFWRQSEKGRHIISGQCTYIILLMPLSLHQEPLCSLLHHLCKIVQYAG